MNIDMLTCPDAPKTLRLQPEREGRIRMLHSEHVGPLTAFVGEIRRQRSLGDEVPFFDRATAGLHARALFLLEAPGRKAVVSGFVSRNNPDETAKNSFELHQEAGFDRKLTALSNIVPWYVIDVALIP